jgi:hypothetical protein
MSQEKYHSNVMDVTGRVLSLEQRVKGLQGRIAAIEARLSCAGDLPAGNSYPAEDFVPATRNTDHLALAEPGIPGDEKCPANPAPGVPGTTSGLPEKQTSDLTGLLAGAILIGAGLLLLTGNLEILKNPLAAIGCGILLIAGSLKRKLYK